MYQLMRRTHKGRTYESRISIAPGTASRARLLWGGVNLAGLEVNVGSKKAPRAAGPKTGNTGHGGVASTEAD